MYHTADPRREGRSGLGADKRRRAEKTRMESGEDETVLYQSPPEFDPPS